LKNKSNKQDTALYCRTAQYSDIGIEAQQRNLRSYAKKHGYTDLVLYTDNGVSGLTFDRPAFNKLQADIEAGLIGTVIVKSCSRIGRNAIEVTQWIRKMTEMGVDIISLDNPTGLLPTELDMNIVLAIALKGGEPV